MHTRQTIRIHACGATAFHVDPKITPEHLIEYAIIFSFETKRIIRTTLLQLTATGRINGLHNDTSSASTASVRAFSRGNERTFWTGSGRMTRRGAEGAYCPTPPLQK